MRHPGGPDGLHQHERLHRVTVAHRLEVLRERVGGAEAGRRLHLAGRPHLGGAVEAVHSEDLPGLLGAVLGGHEVPEPVAQHHAVGPQARGACRRTPRRGCGARPGPAARPGGRRAPAGRPRAGPAAAVAPGTPSLSAAVDASLARRTAPRASARARRSGSVRSRSGSSTRGRVEPVGGGAGRGALQHLLVELHAGLGERRLVPLEQRPPARLAVGVLAGEARRRSRSSVSGSARLEQQDASRLVSRSTGRSPSRPARQRARDGSMAPRAPRRPRRRRWRPGVSTPATPASASFGHVRLGDDAADHDRDVGTALAHLLDHLRRQRHVGAREHRQADGVDVLVDGGRRHRLGRLEQAGVDHLEAGVAQDARHHLDAAVVAVEADLRHQHPVARPPRGRSSSVVVEAAAGLAAEQARPRPSATAAAAARTAAP